jgi:predicted RecA/RadA family phage recombinase
MAGGQLKSDGRATLGAAITLPAGDFYFGECFRVAGITGINMKTVLTADTDRNVDFEISTERVWYFPIPAGTAAARGAYLYWTTAAAATLQRGDTHLVATVNGVPAVFVEEAKDGNNIIAGRVLNIGLSGA